MSKYTIEDTTLTAIADKLRETSGETEPITPEEMPSVVDKVFQAGEKSEYDKFWDAYQENGNKTNYSIYNGAFVGRDWTDDLFKPKYPMYVTDAQMMFRQTGISDLTKAGVVLDFSRCAAFNYAFAFSAITKLPTIDLSSATNTATAFNDGKFKDLSLIVSETTPVTTMLSGTEYLENLTINGVIGTNNPRFDDSTVLTHESLLSILNALKDYSGDTSGTEWKVTLGNVNLAKLSEDDIAIAEEKGWVLA